MREQIQLVKQKIQEAKRIVITSHVSPDGDAIGSSLGLYHFLKDKCEQVDVIVPNAFPSFLSWLEGSKNITIFEKSKDAASELLQKADIIFSLDYNETKRTAFVKDTIDSSDAYKIIIDHHIGEPKWQDLNLSTVGASSTCELILDFIEAYAGIDFPIPEEIAYPLYTGLLTDTGNFQFSATTPKVHIQAAKLMDAGVQSDLVHNHINNSYSEERLKFFGFCIAEKLKFVTERKLAYMFLSETEMKRFNIGTGGTEGLVNEPMKISSIEISVLFKQDGEKVKVSFRSKGSIDVNAFAKNTFKEVGTKMQRGGSHLEALRRRNSIF